MLIYQRFRACHLCITLLVASMIFAILAIAELPVLGPLSAAEMEQRLVDQEWLIAHIDDADLVIIDTRTRKRYQEGHIDGAVSLSVWDTFGKDPRDDLAAPISKIQTLFSNAGVDQATRVLLYDDGEMINAARVFWVLETHGHRRVAILNPGYQAWVEKQLPTNNKVVVPARRHFLSHITPHRLATKFSTRLAVSDPGTVIIDARSSEEYRGQESRSARSGHIPGAVSMPSADNLKSGTAGLKDFSELKTLYSGIDSNKKVIAYCNKGRDSALTYFILRQLGYDVAAYDGSWYEWGNDAQLPVEVGVLQDAYQ